MLYILYIPLPIYLSQELSHRLNRLKEQVQELHRDIINKRYVICAIKSIIE